MLLAAALPAPMPLQAAEGLPPVVITAGRIAEDSGRVSADVSLIERSDIERLQLSTVADVLRAQPGLDVASSGGPGKITSVFLRGANSGQTLVLIDGVRVGSATTGSFDWSALSTADIERIEIVRGPQSSLYGADAMGGVIQIFTRKGTGKTRVQVNILGGSHQTAQAGVNVSGMGEGGIGYAIGLDGLRTKGISAVANTPEKDPYRRLTGTAHLTVPLGDGEVELVLRNSDGRTSLDNGVGPADAANFNSKTRQTVSSIKGDFPLSDILDSSLQLSRSTDTSKTSDPVTAFNNSDFRTDIDQITWQNHIDLDALSLLAGGEWRRDKGFSGSSRLDKAFVQDAIFIGSSFGTETGDVSASLRYDANSASSNKATYKIGGALRPLAELRLTANYGTGFKAPSINQLFFPGFGNPNLNPEQSRGWDAGLHYRQDRDDLAFGFDTVWFDQRFTNLVVTTLVTPPSTYAPLNVGNARTSGLELSGKLSYGQLYARASWTYLHAVNNVDGTRLPRRAGDAGSLLIGTDVAGLNIEAQTDIVGPRFSTTGNAKPMRGYHKTDIRLAYAVDRTWKIRARVENLENKKYEEVSGYGVLGQAWYAGVSATF